MRSLLAPASRSLRLAVLVVPLLVACSDRRAELTGPMAVLAPAAVRVQVRDPSSGAPVEGAQVMLQATDVGDRAERPLLGAITDAAGAALVGDLPPGRYRVLVRRIGYQQTERMVDVGRSSHGAIALALSLAASPGCFLGSRSR